MELETAVFSDQWLVVRKTSLDLLATDHWPLLSRD